MILSFCALLAPVSAQVTSSQTIPPRANPTFTPGSHKYYYYPEMNVYFDEANGNYWFKDNPSSATWKRTRTLPSTFKPGKTNVLFLAKSTSLIPAIPLMVLPEGE